MMRIVLLLVALLASVVAFAPSRVASRQSQLNLFKKKATPAAPPAPAAPAKKAGGIPGGFTFGKSKAAATPSKPTPAAAPAKKAGGIPGGFSFGKSKASAPAAAPAATKGKLVVIKSVPKSDPNVDYTWGGRPDPTPEARIDDSASFLSAAWRYNSKSPL